MPRLVAHRLSTQRRHNRADTLLRTGILAMRPCASCVLPLAWLCILSTVDERCEQCFRHNRPASWPPRTSEVERLLRKKEEFEEQILALEAKTLRVRKQKRLLQKKLRELRDREEQNIQDLELDELMGELPQPSSSESTIPAPGPTSPTGLSQVSFGSFGRTSPVPSGSQ